MIIPSATIDSNLWTEDELRVAALASADLLAASP
jgi:hypothetical protein